MAEKEGNRKNIALYTIVLLIALVIALVLFIVFTGRGFDISDGSAENSVTITYKLSGFKENVSVKDVTFPLDSEAEVCDVFKKAFRSQFVEKYELNCTLKSRASTEPFWYAQTNIVCEGDNAKCFGFCNGRIYETDGRIEEANCYMTVN